MLTVSPGCGRVSVTHMLPASTLCRRRHALSRTHSSTVAGPRDGVSGGLRDHRGHHDRQRGAPGSQPPTRRLHARSPVDRRRLQSFLRLPRPDRRIVRGPLRAQAGPSRGPGGVRSEQRLGRSGGLRPGSDRHPLPHGRLRRRHLPHHLVDHHQHLPRRPRQSQGRRAVGSRHRPRCRRRARHRRCPPGPIHLAGGVRRPRTRRHRRSHRRLDLGARIPRRAERAPRPVGTAAVLCRRGHAGVHDHRGARSRLERPRQPRRVRRQRAYRHALHHGGTRPANPHDRPATLPHGPPSPRPASP